MPEDLDDVCTGVVRPPRVGFFANRPGVFVNFQEKIAFRLQAQLSLLVTTSRMW